MKVYQYLAILVVGDQAKGYSPKTNRLVSVQKHFLGDSSN